MHFLVTKKTKKYAAHHMRDYYSDYNDRTVIFTVLKKQYLIITVIKLTVSILWNILQQLANCCQQVSVNFTVIFLQCGCNF